MFEKFTNKIIMKTRIVAIALICIMLSSSSLSVANGFTISLAVTEVNGKIIHNNLQKTHFKIDLLDGVAASIDRQNKEQTPFRFNLFDGIQSSLDNKQNDEQQEYETTNPRKFSVGLLDGVGATAVKYKNQDDKYVKIISIKLDHDRKALWERIFPLDRIRNGEKQSLYKVIQDDHGLLYLQEESKTDNEPVDFQLIVSESQQHVKKFIGKANYVAENLADHIKRLSDVDKFVGKSLFLGNQISVNAQRLADVEKFVGKANYVSDKIAFQVYRLTDTDKFIEKSKFVGGQIVIISYQTFDEKNPTLLLS